ncbi:NAD-dependent protein deacetylase sirtuin-1 [Thoreauomyces humboldtii]|nr:NAD-dependent protein deacetylase sirtuin-1 [Thoreauomyces humboldtii]
MASQQEPSERRSPPPAAKRVKLSTEAAPTELELGTSVHPHLHVGAAPKVDRISGQRPPLHTPTEEVSATWQLMGAQDSEEGDVLNETKHPKAEDIQVSEKTLGIMQDEARHLDFWEWLDKYGALPFPILFEVFGYKLPPALCELRDDDLLPLLKTVMQKKVAKRDKRSDINTMDQVISLLQTCENIVVLTGAGVSVSCGIPDFRSKNGIYSRLDEFNLDDPQQMFDLEYFKIQPETFYTFAKEIYPSNFRPSPSHAFIKVLEERGKLLRNYTQNIDTLEQRAGIERVVQCHGSFASAKCIVCGYAVDGSALKEDIFNQTVPICPKCPEDDNGVMKPGITFFGEMLPDAFDRKFAEDKDKCDLLIVMGSSLKVSPVADVKDKIPHNVPQLLINMESLPHMAGFDVQLLGHCDRICEYLCGVLGWELPKREPEEQAIQAHNGEAASVGKPINPEAQNPTAETGSTTSPDGEPWRRGRLPHHYLFEGAVGVVDLEEGRYYVPSDREDASGTSESDSDDEGSSAGEQQEEENGLPSLPADTPRVGILDANLEPVPAASTDS